MKKMRYLFPADYMADPSVHVFNDRVYIYPSHDWECENVENDNGDQYVMKDSQSATVRKARSYRSPTRYAAATASTFACCPKMVSTICTSAVCGADSSSATATTKPLSRPNSPKATSPRSPLAACA